MRWLESNEGLLRGGGEGEGEGEREYVVCFQALLDGEGGRVREWLGRRGWGEVWRGFNSHWIDDGRRRGDVVVLKRGELVGDVVGS